MAKAGMEFEALGRKTHGTSTATSCLKPLLATMHRYKALAFHPLGVEYCWVVYFIPLL
jgi:hypothetical protein